MLGASIYCFVASLMPERFHSCNTHQIACLTFPCGRKINLKAVKFFFSLRYLFCLYCANKQVKSLSQFAIELGFLVEEYAASRGKLPPRQRRKKKSVYVATIEKVGVWEAQYLATLL